MAGLQPQCKVFPTMHCSSVNESTLIELPGQKNLNASITMFRIGFYIETRRIFKEKMVVYHSVIISQKTSGQAVAKKNKRHEQKTSAFWLITSGRGNTDYDQNIR